MPEEVIALITGGLGVSSVLTIMLMANFAGRWYSRGAVDKIVQGYQAVITEQANRIAALQTDRNFYRELVLRVAQNQEMQVENQEKIVSIVERQAKPNGTTV